MTPNNDVDRRKQRLRRLSRLMDSSIRLPGGYRIGWDGIIGLVPGIGDLIGLAISLYIVSGAWKLGASPATLLRMVANVGVESAIGAIPVAGDLFDLVFKANNRNIRLLEKHSIDPVRTHRQSRWTLLALLGFVLLVFVVVFWLVMKLFGALVSVIV